jgi:hypothetical protein
MKYLSNHPGLVILFSFLMLPIFNTCSVSEKKEHSQAEKDNEVVLDTRKKTEIDTIVAQINDSVQAQVEPKVLIFPTSNSHDTIKYWTIDQEPVRISLTMSTDQYFIWPTFFISNKHLVFVRYRAWHRELFPSIVLENMIYLDGDQVVYCEERKLQLLPGELPVLLREKSYTPSRRSPSDIKKDYEDYWSAVKSFFRKETGSMLE